MKKILTILLSTALVFTSTFVAFASSENSANHTIKLDISENAKDILIIEKYQKKKDLPLSKDKNNISLTFNRVQEDGDIVKISGVATVKMFGEVNRLVFEEKSLEIKYLKNKKFYSGSIETKADENHTALLDITTTYNFSKSVISCTLIDDINDTHQIMLFGNTFKEQIELFNQELENAKQANAEKIVKEIPMMKNLSIPKASSAYQQVKNTYSERLNGESSGKQMVVMSVSKCDPNDFGSGNEGYEAIRVFSRSYNIPKVETTALLAKPLRMNVEFVGDRNLFAVEHTKPTNGNGTLQSAFNLFLSVVDGSGIGQPLAIISNIIKSLNLPLEDRIAVSGTTASFNVSVNDKTPSYIDYTEGDLSGNAHLNKNNGVTFKVSYQRDAGVDTSTINVTSNITYQVFLNTNRTVSWKSGTSSVSHVVDLN